MPRGRGRNGRAEERVTTVRLPGSGTRNKMPSSAIATPYPLIPGAGTTESTLQRALSFLGKDATPSELEGTQTLIRSLEVLTLKS